MLNTIIMSYPVEINYKDIVDESSSVMITAFTSKDILCGRGTTAFSHSGTQRFRSYIARSMDAYISAPGRAAKTKLVQRLTDEILNEGFVFWKKDAQKVWCRLSLKEAREKVGHTLRDSTDGRIKCMKEVQKRVLKHEELQTRTMQIFQDLVANIGESIEPSPSFDPTPIPIYCPDETVCKAIGKNSMEDEFKKGNQQTGAYHIDYISRVVLETQQESSEVILGTDCIAQDQTNVLSDSNPSPLLRSASESLYIFGRMFNSTD